MMKTYLLTWNPRYWPWDDLEDELLLLEKKGYLDSGWSCRTKQIRPGDRVFLLRQGKEPRGIVASGQATSEVYEGEHFAEAGKVALYADIRFDIILNPSIQPILTIDTLKSNGIVNVPWNTRSSGVRIDPDSAINLERLWDAFLGQHGLSPIKSSEQIDSPERFFEGALRIISVNAYERDPRAREACIKHHGTMCAVCSLSFENKYGELGKGFIHVHHLVPLSHIGHDYSIDPIKDLLPVCPNCHAMLHRSPEVMTIEELRKTIRP